jgi:hypothetical protein
MRTGKRRIVGEPQPLLRSLILMAACHGQLRFRNPHPAARVYTLRTTQPDLVRTAGGVLRFTYGSPQLWRHRSIATRTVAVAEIYLRLPLVTASCGPNWSCIGAGDERSRSVGESQSPPLRFSLTMSGVQVRFEAETLAIAGACSLRLMMP